MLDLKKMNAFRKENAEYRALNPALLRFFEKYILPCWWVVFFLVLANVAYKHSLVKVHEERRALAAQYEQLLSEKKQALMIQEDALLQINSQSDQDWLELTLMKGLGLVPEEQIKVFFTTQE